VLVVLTALPVWSGEVTGRVFVDANGDGAWQQGEAAVAGALVSDGTSVAAVDADGEYAMQVADGDQVVFVVNPPDTWPTAGFYRNVRVGPARADFPMRTETQSLPFYFVQGTDLHVRDEPLVREYVARYVQTINEMPLPIAFVVHTGDLVVDANGARPEQARALFEAYREMVANVQPPLLNLPGNHEYTAIRVADVPPDAPGWGPALYRELFGPTWYAFTYAGVQFIAMDGNTMEDGKLKWDLSDACIEWLRTYLEHVSLDAPIVMLVHEPFKTMGKGHIVEEALEGRKVLLALSGHGHGIARWQFAGATEIMGGATSYAWHGGGFGPQPIGYHVIRIRDDGFDSAFADWAEKYSLTTNAPSRLNPLTEETSVEAVIFDPANEITSVDIALGVTTTAVNELGEDGLYRTISSTISPTGLVDGFHDMVFTMRGTGEPFEERQSYLVLTGTEEAFAAEAPATLRVRMHKVAAPNTVTVNGTQVATMPLDATEGRVLEVELPAAGLKRLNVVEIVSARQADGAWDDFWVDAVDMMYQGEALSDERRRKYNSTVVRPKDDQPGRATIYIDLTRAHKQ